MTNVGSFGLIVVSETGKFVLEKGLELGQAAAENYVSISGQFALWARPEVMNCKKIYIK